MINTLSKLEVLPLRSYRLSFAILFFLWVSILLLLGSSFAYGQFLKPKINNFSPEQYEAHTQTFCSAKDSNGVLYFGTNKYVLQYNGSEWRKIFVKEGFSVYSMAIDEEGRIWVGGNGDFGYLAPDNEIPAYKTDTSKDDKIQPFSISNQKASELHFVSLANQIADSLRNFNIIWKIHAVNNKVVFNTNKKHLFIASKNGISTIKANNNFFTSEVISSEALGTDSGGRELWIQSRDKGILRCQLEKNKIDKSCFKLLPRSDFFNDKNLVAFVPWDHNEVIICTGKSGLYKYRFGEKAKEPGDETGKDRITRFAGSLTNQLSNAKVYGANRLKPKNNAYSAALNVYTNWNGLWLLKPNGEMAVHVSSDKDLSNNFVWDCIKDDGNQLWACTDNGISQLAIANAFTVAEEGEAFSGVVTDVSYYSDQKKALFIATMQGVYKVNKGSRNMAASFKLIPGTKGQNLTFKRAGHKLLLGRGHDGLYQIDKTSEGWKTKRKESEHTFAIAKAPKKVTDSFTSKPIVAFGGLEGIVLLQANEDKWERQLTIKNLPEVIRSLTFSHQYYQDSLILWTSFSEKGVLRIAIAKDIFRSNHSENHEKANSQAYNKTYYHTKDGLPKGLVKTFPLGDQIVFGTDSGLYKARSGLAKNSANQKVADHNQTSSNPSANRFSPDSSLGQLFTPEKANGQGKMIRMLLTDKQGHTWVKSDQTYHLITHDNGYKMDSLSFKSMDIGTVRAICPGAEPNITWIGGNKGLVKYDSRENKDFLRNYNCLISKVALPGEKVSGGDSILLHGKYYAYDSTLNPPWQIVQSQPDWMVPSLTTDINRISFHFSAPYFEKQEAIQYSYKMVGFDDEWSKWSNITKREYTNLPPGQYNFKVKAKNIYEHESNIASYKLKVLAPFHRTAWFYVIQVGVLFFLGVISVYFARTQTGRAAKFAISLGTVVIFLIFEYCQNYVEVYFEDYLGGVVAFKVALNVLVITLLIPFKTVMERWLLIQQNYSAKEGIKQRKVKQYKKMNWGTAQR